MNPEPVAPTRWRSQTFAALKGLLGLIVAFVPEIIATFVGAVSGGVVGVVFGLTLSGSLFEGSGGGSWGHAGVFALILPVFAFLGPFLVCLVVGAVLAPCVTLAVHAVVILVSSGDRLAPRRLAVLTCAAAVLGPALLTGLLSEDLPSGLLGGLMFLPLTAPCGVLAGAAIAGVRAVLAGRSFGQWWRAADGSMGVVMLTASVGAWLGTWLPLLLFFVFPAVFLSLVGAIVLGIRLWVAGNRRGLVAVILVVNLAHAVVFGWAAVQVAADPGPAQDDEAVLDGP